MRVAITRPRERSGHGFAVLREMGFIPVQRRLIRIENDVTALNDVAPRLSDYDWLLFTSAEAVRSLDAARRGAGAPWPHSARAACVGPATAQAASAAGLPVALVPERYDGASLGEALARDHALGGARFLWPRAEAANTGLADALRAGGAHVEDVVAYRTVASECGARRLSRDVHAGTIGAVLFFSPSAVDACGALVGALPDDVVIGVIGRSTAERARMAGMTVHVQPPSHTIRSLAESLREYIGDSTES